MSATTMSRVRLLVGTRKGAFILSADAERKRWRIDGPQWMHGAGGMCPHSEQIPDPAAEVGHCVHRTARAPRCCTCN